MIKINFFTFNPLAENTYVLSNEKKEALIIDPGFYFTEEENTFKDFISVNNLNPVKLLNTHCHLDHVFGNDVIYKTYGLELCMHEGELLVLQAAPEVAVRWGLAFKNYTGNLHFVSEEDEIFLGDDKLKILFTPGHSPASVCFYCEAQNFVIGGDVLFKESIGRYDFPGSDEQTLYKSIREKLYTLPDETIVYPGHGETTTIGYEKKYNPFVRLS